MWKRQGYVIVGCVVTQINHRNIRHIFAMVCPECVTNNKIFPFTIWFQTTFAQMYMYKVEVSEVIFSVIFSKTVT